MKNKIDREQLLKINLKPIIIKPTKKRGVCMKFNKVERKHEIKKIKSEFYYGSLENNLEEQANKQGLTLGDKARLFEELKNARLLLRSNKIITESQADNALEKIHEKLLKILKVMNNENLKIIVDDDSIEFNEQERIFDEPKHLSFRRNEVLNESNIT